MKRTPSGLLILDLFDVGCLAFSFGATVCYVIEKQKTEKNIDSIIGELKRKSRIFKRKSLVIPIYTDGTEIKVNVVAKLRGGHEIKGLYLISLILKNKKLITLIKNFMEVTRKRKQIRLFFAIVNAFLTSSIGIRFASGVSLSYMQFLQIIFPSSAAGFLV
jgi:hypothetical protein